MKLNELIVESEQHHEARRRWLAACRKVAPNCTVAGLQSVAQAVDWMSDNNEVIGDWKDGKGVVYKPGSKGSEVLELIEAAGSHLRKINTETGTAVLNPATGVMTLNNSGYIQELSKEQVAAVWSGAEVLPLSQEQINDRINDDFEPPQTPEEHAEIARYVDEWQKEGFARYDPFLGLWDFGDEQHYIPSQEEFAPQRRNKNR